MIQVVSLHNDIPSHANRIRSHVLTPRPSVTVIILLQWQKENIISILEDHILETVSGVEWSDAHSDVDFTYITEHYNRFIKNLETDDLEGVSILLGLLKNDELTVSSIGEAGAYLVEGESVTLISSTEKHRYDFHTLTSGQVARNASIYLSNTHLQEIVGDELLLELDTLDEKEIQEVMVGVFKREIQVPLAVIRLAHPRASAVRSQASLRGGKQSDVIREKGTQFIGYVKNHAVWGKIRDKASQIGPDASPTQKYAFLTIGGILLAFLIYFLFKWFAGTFTGGYDEAKAQVQQAQTLIEEAQKLSGNPEAFENNINQAQQILFSLRKEQKYLADTQELQNRIEVLKKEAYDIQTVDLSQKQPLLSAADIDAVDTVEIDNKITLIGKKGVISDYVRSWEVPGVVAFPQGDEAINATVTDNKNIYILTNTNRLITIKQNTASYVNAMGENAWESGGGVISTYNGNLYTLDTAKSQILRYRPAVNGFSQKSNILPSAYSGTILDMGIDGGFYLLLSDGKVGRFISTNNAGVVSLSLNKIPSAWNIDTSLTSQLIGNEKLSYVYIRNGKKVWIFEPNSRRFQDISALSYIAQLEIESAQELRSISIPRDGLIYATTATGVYEVGFEISNGKLILK